VDGGGVGAYWWTLVICVCVDFFAAFLFGIVVREGCLSWFRFRGFFLMNAVSQVVVEDE